LFINIFIHHEWQEKLKKEKIGQRVVHAGESIAVQKWNIPQGGQVHYTDAAAGEGRGIK